MCQKKNMDASVSGVCSASSGKARRLYSYLLWCHSQLYNLLPQPAEHWSKSIAKKNNPKTVSTISKTKKSCRASLAFAKCPFLANTAQNKCYSRMVRGQRLLYRSPGSTDPLAYFWHTVTWPYSLSRLLWVGSPCMKWTRGLSRGRECIHSIIKSDNFILLNYRVKPHPNNIKSS